MADDQEKTEDAYFILRHRNKVSMTALTLGSTQRSAQSTLCFSAFFYLALTTLTISVYGVSFNG